MVKHSPEVMATALTQIGGSKDLRTFKIVFTPLTKNGKQGTAALKQAWEACDPNGNGYVSLAEFDGWIRTALGNSAQLWKASEANRIWELFRPSYIRAHTDAADVLADKRVGGTRSATTDDYIERKEFRPACAYLIIYAGMLDAFR